MTGLVHDYGRLWEKDYTIVELWFSLSELYIGKNKCLMCLVLIIIMYEVGTCWEAPAKMNEN